PACAFDRRGRRGWDWEISTDRSARRRRADRPTEMARRRAWRAQKTWRWPCRRRCMRTATATATAPRRARTSWTQHRQRAQEVAAEDLAHAIGGPAALQHQLAQDGELEARLHVARRDDGAVPVAAERRMIFADDVDDVRQVLDDRLGAAAHHRIAEEARLVHDGDDAAGVGDGAQLLVVDVAPMAVDAGDAGVADEERQRAIVRGDGV